MISLDDKCNYCDHDRASHLGMIIMKGTDKPTFCHKCSCRMWNDGPVTLREELDRIITKNVVYVMDKIPHAKYTNGMHKQVLDEIELVIARYYKYNFRVEEADSNTI